MTTKGIPFPTMNSLASIKVPKSGLSKIRHYADGGEVSNLDEPNITEGDEQDSVGQLSSVLGGVSAINLPSAQNAKPVGVDDKGIVTFDNGVKHFPDGHIEQQTSDGSRWFKANPYAKMVRLPGKDPNQIFNEKAAAKGIRAEDYGDPEAFKQAARTALGGTSEEDAKAIADGVQQGAIPPTLQGLYRARAHVASILQQRGYNLKDATLDYTAAQRAIGSQNSPQFMKMRGSMDQVEHALDIIDDLSSKWKAGGFKLLNKARLESAKQGILGPEATKIATLLDQQIADMTFGLANVYMGGGTPTDQGLQLAQKNLSGDWSEDVLKAATQQARQNIQIRRNSLNHIPVTGLQGQLAPQGQPQPNPSQTPLATPQPQAQSGQLDIQGAAKFVSDHSNPSDPLFKKAQDVKAHLESLNQNAGQPAAAVASQ